MKRIENANANTNISVMLEDYQIKDQKLFRPLGQKKDSINNPDVDMTEMDDVLD